MILDVYVPAPGSPAADHIRHASAILSDPRRTRDGRVLIYFEGNLNGATNLTWYRERLACAAGRLVTSYPTVAQARIPANQLHLVARYDAARYVLTDVLNQIALEAYAMEQIHEIQGRSLPPGDVDWAVAANLVNVGATMLARAEHENGDAFYRSLAGQIFRFRLVEKTVRCFEPTDPAIRAILDGKLDEQEKRLAFGDLRCRRRRIRV